MEVDGGRGVKRGAEAPGQPAGSGDVGGADMLREILMTVKSTEAQLNKVQRDVNDAKEIAAKSLAQSAETKQELEGLKGRICRLEKEGSVSSGASQGSWDPWFRAKADRDTVRAENNWSANSRFDLVGGPKGVALIIGGFPKWSRTDKLKEWYATLQTDMGELAGDVKAMFPPGTRGHILQIELHEKATTRESRLNTLDFVKKFKALDLKVKMGEEEFRIWASPSKPESVRAQDRETTNAVATIKELLKDKGNVEESLDMNYTQGRIWWGDQLVVQRDRVSGKLSFREEALKAIDPAVTSDKIQSVLAKIKKDKEAERAKQ